MVTAMCQVDGEDSPGTRPFFTKLNLPQTFLNLLGSEWGNNDEYKTVVLTIQRISVTNDHAERGGTLIQQFSVIGMKNSRSTFYKS